MDFSFTYQYLNYVFAVTIASLFMIVFGGWVQTRLHKGGLRFAFANKSKYHRKLTGFILFIVSIFLLGFLSERLQQSLYNYFQYRVATSIIGIILILVVAWFLYDWLVWRKHNGV
jgi:hypothetical protein